MPGVALAVQERITSWPPKPKRPTVCGLPWALSVILRVAKRAPKAEGVNITATVQGAPAATELAQVSVSAKSVAAMPVTAKLVVRKGASPVLVTVIV